MTRLTSWERLVATKAVCQALLHIPKIPIFIWLGNFDYARFGMLPSTGMVIRNY